MSSSGKNSRATRRWFTQHALCMGAAAAACGPLRLCRAQAGAPAEIFAAAQTGGLGGFTGAGSLQARAAGRGLLTGAAVNMELLGSNAAYTRTLAEQYNVVVAENAMKWAALRPEPERFDFAEADRFVSFAEAHGMQIRGHNLCWHESLPGWFAATVNRGNAEQFLTTHIATVAGRYRGRIRAWDVVNEAIDPKDGLPGGLRNSPWYRLLGPDYLAIAFRAARAADPRALLTYNDYGIETDSADNKTKRAAVLDLVQGMRGKGVPIDAVGIQSHLSAGSAKQIGTGITAFVDRLAALGLKVFVTELDVNDDAIAVDDPGERGRQVAAIYRDYVTLLLAHPAVTDVLTWGVSNGASWLNARGSAAAKFRPRHPNREQLCLPFDDGYTPDAAFYGLRDAIGTRKQ